MAYAPNLFIREPSFNDQDIHKRIFVDGIEEDVKKLNNAYEFVKAVLSDAENRQLTEGAARVWVERLRDISYEIEDALDVWNTVLLKKQISGAENTRGSNSYRLSDCSWLKHLAQKAEFPSRIIKLNEKLDAYSFTSKPVAAAPPLPPRRESSSFIKASTVCGRDLEIQRLVGNLCDTSRRKEDLEVISVVGMGGIGKTTLAQRVYNDATVKCHFQKRIWACVSDPFDEVQVCKAIAKSLEGNPSEDLQDILEYINGSIAKKRYLLVLDDVWTEDSSHWESLLSSLDSGADGSKILVTTRKIECARAIGSTTTSMHSLGQLSPDDSWKLFSQIAFFDKTEEDVRNLKEVGQKIAEKCKGLPLALKAIASHLQFKNTEREWQRVLESEIWELETAEKRIFKPLLLSYNDLPSPIKKCFSFCAAFPKDYEFGVEKLIRLWMSQGYLNTSRNEDMETVGEEYFQHLVTRSFFQDLEFEENLSTISGCKMHDIVHDFAQFLSKDESLIIDIDTDTENKKPGLSSSSCKTLRHLTVLNAKNGSEDVMSSSFSNIIQQRLHLHTLMIRESSIIGKRGMMNFLPNPSRHLCFIKALDFRNSGILEVPEEIGQLVHLRYLDLSWNRKVERLPVTIYELCNLQTLLLYGCRALGELPKGIEKLINLRHLEVDEKTVLPKGIGSVSSLLTLILFNVGRDEGYGGEVGAAAATIGDLGNLNNLQGNLYISHLRNVKDGREASKAELRNKKGLIYLRLDFGEGEGIEGHEEEVIEALEPPCHSLEALQIFCYSGKLLPRWIASSSLTKLRKLYLSNCIECEELPPLGQLPFLEKLEIRVMNSCKRIGEEFLGMKRSGGGRDGKKMTTTSSIAVAFPKLKELKFDLMLKWKEWEDILSTGDDDDLTDFKLFPCLNTLDIWNCGKLKSMPQFISKSRIKTLKIWHCPILGERCQPEAGEDWSKISHIPNIEVKGDTGFEIKDGQLQYSDMELEKSEFGGS